MAREWTGKTDGTRWMQNALISIFRHIDVRVMYGVMAVVIVFYMFFRRTSYNAIKDYFTQCFGLHGWQRLRAIYRNHYQFGQVVLDRFAAYAGRQYQFLYEGIETYNEVVNQEAGAIVIQSHIGNFEMAGYSLDSKKRMHVLAFTGESEVVLQNRAALLAEHNIHLIPVNNEMDHVVTLYNALQTGDILCIPGDRRLGSDKAIACQLFGRTAYLPEGVFRMAAITGVSIMAIFVMKERWDTYKVFTTRLTTPQGVSRQEQMQSLAQQYATYMEKLLRQYPLQWYHYFDFWKE